MRWSSNSAGVSLGALLLLAIALARIAAAQDRSEPAVDKPSAELRAAHLARMRDLVGSMKVLAVPGQKDSAVKLAAEPVLRYTDSTRHIYESALWIWTGGGRPVAIAAIEYYPHNPPAKQWMFEVASLSTERIAAQRGSDLAWTAKEPGLVLQAVPAGDPPADKPVRRLAQMKALHRRFTAHEVGVIGGRTELRPLASPLYRYADEAAGVVDAGIFAFTNGTNPEIYVVLEAGKDGANLLAWRYGLARMTGAETIVQLDGKEVWHPEQADPPSVRDNYVNGWFRAELPAE